MTSKEPIIIDGMDVSKCQDFYYSFYQGKISLRCNCDCDNTKSLFCSDNQDCYFKQLARKTQECEELKERKLKLELNENHNKNEIKKLKKRIRKDKEFFKDKISSLTLARKQFLEALDHFNWQISLVKNDTYREALEEIEEVTKYLKKDLCGHCSWYGTDNCNPSGMVCEELIKILDIINKAKGEGNE